MSDSGQLLRKFGLDRGGEPATAPAARPPDAAEEDACAAFGFLRGTRDRALHIEFRLANGNVVAFPYAWLGPVRFDPSRGLVLDFVGDRTWRVAIVGRNLDALQGGSVNLTDRGILRHRVVWVREMDPDEARGLPDGALVVERIDVRRVRPGEDE